MRKMKNFFMIFLYHRERSDESEEPERDKSSASESSGHDVMARYLFDGLAREVRFFSG
jgi:hypothetical protein